LLPAGAVAGWALHPLESAALSRRTPDSDIKAAARSNRYLLKCRASPRFLRDVAET
jgi:hypothetical protein